MNSVGKQIPMPAPKVVAACFVHPDDLTAIGGTGGGGLTETSAHGAIRAAAVADATMRRGVVAMTHLNGGLPGDEVPGANVNVLLSTETDLQTISAMPLMSAVPVSVTAD